VPSGGHPPRERLYLARHEKEKAMAKRKCKFGVSKTTGKCLKTRRKRAKKSCKFGVSKTTGKCLKRKRVRRSR
jgi:hypothetical protein